MPLRLRARIPQGLRPVLAVLTVACGPAAAPPDATSFLVAAGDSTFWVVTGGDGFTTRRSPLLLARIDGRFHELYVADEDLSYRDALMVGQRVYRRDLRSGDSVLVRYDSSIATVAAAWASRNPGDEPLGPDDETSEDPLVQATTDTELLDVVGPYLSFEFHLDVDIHGERDQHVTQRGVVDLRDGRRVRVEDLVPAGTASRVYAEGRERLSAALDSIRRAKDERATRARSMIAGFTFDSTSFELVSGDAGPAIAFLVPGQGPRAGGYSLPLGEIPIDAGPWWQALALTLPTRGDDATVVWADSAYDVVVTAEAGDASASLEVRHGTRRRSVTALPLPVRRVFRLGTTHADSAERLALTRAFDEADAYGGFTRTTMRTPRPRLSSFRPASAWNPGLRATAKRSSPTS